MKIMIASDIHGSEYFCKKLISAFESEKPDKLLLLGDILYHGPRNALPRDYYPAGVAEILNTIKESIICIHGNCDSEVDQLVLDFPITAENCILYAGGHMIFATHGHILNTANPPKLNSSDYLLCGHTHVPVCETQDGFTYINPGSVSIPKQDSENSYMILDDDGFVWKNLDGNEFMRRAF